VAAFIFRVIIPDVVYTIVLLRMTT